MRSRRWVLPECIESIIFLGFLAWVFWCKVDAPAYAITERQANVPTVISWIPEEPRQGDVVIVSVALGQGLRVKNGRFEAKPLYFFTDPAQPGRAHAMLGVDASKEPGRYSIEVFLESESGSEVPVQEARLNVLARDFEEEHLTLPNSMVNLSKESLDRVQRDKRAIAALWSKATAERFWQGSFIFPVEGKPGSPFGLRRWINKEPRNFHTGADVKAPEGTPVLASNRGRVALTGDFFFSGNSVFVDHGQGLYTMYFHLSGINVEENALVGKGEVIGWIGKTGRATGPHLHWGVRLGGERVDPEALIRSSLHFSGDNR